MQGARSLRNEAYIERYAAVTKDEAQRRRWTFYEAVTCFAYKPAVVFEYDKIKTIDIKLFFA
jgi:hypothetical protein